MSARDKNARDYKRLAASQVKMEGPTLGNAELHYLSTLPDSELLKIPRVAEIQGSLAESQSMFESAVQDSALAEGLDRHYSNYTKGLQFLGVARDMMGKQTINLALHYGRNIEGAARAANRREPISFPVQVAIVLLSLITLGVFVSILENAPFGVAMSASPWGLPNWIFLLAIFIIVTLYLRQRSKKA